MEPGFVRDVVAFVTGSLRFPARPWWARQRRCGACGDRLTMPPRRTERPVTVTLAGVPVFTVTLELEAARCPGCGLDNVHERQSGQVAEAVTDALESGAIGRADEPHDAVVNAAR